MNLNVCEVFHSIQGEGNDLGRNVLFVRLAGCNLKCTFCDSKYHIKNPYPLSIDGLVKIYKGSGSNGIVVTGGEPLLQQKVLKELFLAFPFSSITVETNGTIYPDSLITLKDVIRFNVSPKLLSSGNLYGIYCNTLSAINKEFQGIFKFVIKNKHDIEDVINIKEACHIYTNKIYLMPEGKTRKKQLMSQEKIVKTCLKYGFNFSPRLHILIWDKKRGI